MFSQSFFSSCPIFVLHFNQANADWTMRLSRDPNYYSSVPFLPKNNRHSAACDASTNSGLIRFVFPNRHILSAEKRVTVGTEATGLLLLSKVKSFDKTTLPWSVLNLHVPICARLLKDFAKSLRKKTHIMKAAFRQVLLSHLLYFCKWVRLNFAIAGLEKWFFGAFFALRKKSFPCRD